MDTLAKLRLPLLTLSFLVLLASTSSAGIVYSGTLSSDAGGIEGTGLWVDKTFLPASKQANWTPVTITWEVSQNADLSWRYSYDFSVYRGELSHMIIETSPNFGYSDVFNASESFVIASHSAAQPSNPNLPDVIYGIKFDITGERTEPV